ncbi:MAG: T9SS type A sorting domain-containing protein [Bacteroidota bacterium]
MRAAVSDRKNLVSFLSVFSLLLVAFDFPFRETHKIYPQPEYSPPFFICEGVTNLALGKTTEQSSDFGLGVSSIAVDGITQGNIGPSEANPTISHTGLEPEAWWQVDLGAVSEMDTLKIFNRTDCCQTRLGNFYFFSSLTPIPATATLSDLRLDPNVQELFYEGTVDSLLVLPIDFIGQFVRIQLSSTENTPLHFKEVEILGCSAIESPDPCEVTIDQTILANPSDCEATDGSITILATGDSLEYSIDEGVTFQSSNQFDTLSKGIYEVQVRRKNSVTCAAIDRITLLDPEGCSGLCVDPENVALGKPASMSSLYGDGLPPLIVDGDTTGSTPWGAEADLVHTDTIDFDSWVEVDLDSLYDVKEIVVYAREDCCPSHLNNFVVLASAEPYDTTLTVEELVLQPGIYADSFPGFAPLGVGAHFQLPEGFQARYIRVMSADSSYLVIAELAVFGCLPDLCTVELDSVLHTDVTDCSLEDGSILLFPFADTLEYSVDGGVSFQDTSSFSGLAAGTYIVAIREKNLPACILIDTVEILSPSVPIIETIISTEPSSCDLPDGSISIEATGDSLEFSINGGETFQNLNIFTGLVPGVYPILVREVGTQTCVASEVATLSIGTGITLDSVIVTQPSDCGISDGRVEVLAIGDSLDYSIDGGITYQESNVFEGLPADTYFLTVRKDSLDDCVIATALTILPPTLPNIDSLTVVDPSSCVLSDGSVLVFATGDSLEYSIDGGQSYQDSALFINLPFGSFEVLVREVTRPACSIRDSVVLTAPQTTLISSVSFTEPSDCGLADGSITIDAEGDTIEYSIDGGVSFVDSNAFANLPAGIYEVVIREKNLFACTDSDSVVLVGAQSPEIDSVAFLPPTDCDSVDGGLTIFASGVNLQYSIDGGETYQDTNFFSDLAPGDISIAVKEVNSNTCIASDTVTLNPANLPEISSILTVDPSDCGLADGSITIEVQVDSLEFSIDGGLSYQDSNTFVGLDSGFYSIAVRVSGEENCAARDTARLFIPGIPVIDSIMGINPSDCGVEDGVIIVEASGDSLAYSSDGGLTFQESNFLSDLGSGIFDIVVREVGTISCIAFEEFSLDSLDLPTVDTIEVTDPTACASNDGLISIRSSEDSLEYSILGMGGFSQDSIFTGLTGGSYPVWVRRIGSSGCIFQDTVELIAPPFPDVDSIRFSNPTDCGVDDGVIEISASGADLEYSIDNGVTFSDTNFYDSLAVGFYPVWIREKESVTCVTIDTVNLVSPPLPAISALNTVEPTDCGLTDGSITIAANGLALEYSIDSGATFLDTSSFANLGSGIYYILVREKGFDNCIATGQVVLDGPLQPEILQIEVLDPQGCGSANGAFNILTIGENFEYSADGGESFQFPNLFSNLRADEYQVVIRNPEFPGCVVDTMVTLTDSLWCGRIDCIDSLLSNVALNKPTTTTGTTTDGGVGVDGDKVGTNESGAEADLVVVTATGDSLEQEPYFEVDLQSIHNLERIHVFPREDCCPEDLQDFFLLVGSKPFGNGPLTNILADTTVSKFQYLGKAPLGEPIVFDLPSGTIGQFIRLTHPSFDRLVFAELEVMGCGLGSPQFYLYSADDTTQLQDPDPFSVIDIYPNPFRTNFTVDLGELNIGNAEVRMINALGQVVFSTTLTSQSIVQVGNNLSPGMYWVEVNFGVRQEQFKIIKQR